LLAAWCLAPAAVPVFDGIGQPDEPYRYVDPPPTAKTTKQPTTAKRVIAVRDGANVGQYANSAEQGPQISVYVAPGSLGVPPGATSVTLTATPLAPQEPLPSDGTILTNVYRVTAQVDGQDVPITGRGQQAAAVSMRAPSAKEGTVFERRTSDGWERLPTLRAGTDIYQTSEVTKFGEFALVLVDVSSDGGGGVNVLLLAGGIAVLLVAGAILVVRMRRTGG
jgi:hypothetical protein